MIALDLRRLRLLRELEERGTLWAVAAALGYSPSAVSQQLTVLEKEAGVPLLERAGRGVKLTDAGREKLRQATDDHVGSIRSLFGERFSDEELRTLCAFLDRLHPHDAD